VYGEKACERCRGGRKTYVHRKNRVARAMSHRTKKKERKKRKDDARPLLGNERKSSEKMVPWMWGWWGTVAITK